MSRSGEDVLGDVVRMHRLRAGLTQQELAHRAGLSIRTLRDLEQDRVARPRALSLNRLATALGMSSAEQIQLLAALGGQVRQHSASLRIGILGPLTVQRDGVPVEIPTRMQRSLLALVALHGGQPVGREEIVDTLWDEPPRTCQSLVHTYVSQLRKLLDRARRSGAAGATIGLTAGGYRLTLPSDAIDLTRFEDLTRRAAQTPPTEAALALYAEALACWRGPILADALPRLRHHPLAAAAAQRRLATTLAHADLAFQLRQHQAAVPLLRNLLPEEPFHEGLHARLMLALHSQGEQAAALRVYTDIRTRLADELGVEPGEELRAANLEVLQTQPVRARVEPGRPNRPAQLPLDAYGFTGRDTELATLDAIAARAHAQPTAVVIAAIAGTGGVGKTALAIHWAHRAAGQFPDGQLYINLRGFGPQDAAMSAAEAMQSLLVALGVPAQQIPPTLPAQVGLYRSLLADRRILLLLDNARDSEQVRPLLPGAPGCLVVATSRDQLRGLVAAEGAIPVHLDLLPHADARELLARRLGHSRLTAEADAVDALVKQCAGLPLALAIVAAQAATRPGSVLRTLARELGDRAATLDVLADGDVTTDLRGVFSASYRSLTTAAAQLFRWLGVHPGPDISAPAAASLAGMSASQIRRTLAELTRTHLIIERYPGRYAFHDLLRAYAAELATHDPVAGKEALRRVLDHYLHTAHAAADLIHPRRFSAHPDSPAPGVHPEQITSPEDAVGWFVAEHEVLLSAISASADHGFDAHTWRLATTMTTYFERRGTWSDWVATQRAALAAAERSLDRRGQAEAHRSLGLAYARTNSADLARDHLVQAIAHYDELGERTGQAYVQTSLSVVAEMMGDYHEALRRVQLALQQFRTVGHLYGQAIALNAIGWLSCLLGNHTAGARSCQEALALFQQIGERSGEAYVWDSLGYAYHQLGRHEEAARCFEHAVALHAEWGNRYYEATGWDHLGDVRNDAGMPGAAAEAWQRALAILDDLTHADAATVRAKLAH
jgi:DNA-binding SARP family transcriptional activator/DNA-binding XRE family transcriptional regulator